MAIQINPKIIAAGRSPDLHDALAAWQTGQISALQTLDAQLAAARTEACQNSWVRLFESEARAQASAADAGRQAGLPAPRLAGLSVSVKDLFDVAGHPATGGSCSLSGEHSALGGAPAAATADALAVARLRAAGASLIGHSNLSEFAFSGVGINPHHGTPANAVAAAVDAVARIPGGSSSGGAAALAQGCCWASLGSDTGGSIRIPAALQGLVGFKNTAALTPLAGCIPLSPTLDTACAITLSVRDAVLLHEVLADRRLHLAGRPLAQRRLAVPSTLMLSDLEPAVAQAFDAALAALRQAGAQIDTLHCPELDELAALNAQGGFAAAESWAWHRHRLGQQSAEYDPRVAARIRRGEHMLAADYLDLHTARQDWIRRLRQRLAGYDAALSPTVPLTAPPLAPLLDDDDLFFRTNLLLLRNPAVVNFYDGCALSLPCQAPGQLPVGLMIWSGAGQDDTVLDLGLVASRSLAARGAH